MINKKRYTGYLAGGILILLSILIIFTFNSLVKKEERVKKQWAEVQNAYQRRLDLIPNLVNTVKGNANFEQNILQEITEARAKANFVNVDVNNPTANSAEAQSQAQNELAGAANKLLITIEKYPELQGTKAFVALQTQLERTELRIKIARKDFNESIQTYNSSVRSFPTKLVAGLFGFKAKPGFTANAGTDKTTEIKF